MTTKLKETKSLGQAWVTAGLVVFVSLFFGLVILPKIQPKNELVGQTAPDFSLPVMPGAAAGVEFGERIELSSLKGKIVVLDFWASWCGPCRQQIPIVDSVARSFAGEEVVVIGVNTMDDHEAARRFISAQRLSYASVIDGDDQVARAYGVRGLPTLVVVDGAGQVVAMRSRFVSQKELLELVESARPG